MITEERIPLLASSMKVKKKLAALAPLYRQVKENFELSFFQKGKLVHQGIYIFANHENYSTPIQALHSNCSKMVCSFIVT